MSNGDPPPVSGAPYIIICSARIAVATAKESTDKLNAVSQGASQLCTYYAVRMRNTLDNTKLKPVSDLQHYIMDNLGMKKEDAEAKCAEMLALMDALEHDLGSGSY